MRRPHRGNAHGRSGGQRKPQPNGMAAQVVGRRLSLSVPLRVELDGEGPVGDLCIADIASAPTHNRAESLCYYQNSWIQIITNFLCSKMKIAKALFVKSRKTNNGGHAVDDFRRI